MRSVASLAALTASVLGMIKRALANSAIASCSLESRVVAKVSRKMDRAASTAPPPARKNLKTCEELESLLKHASLGGSDSYVGMEVLDKNISRSS